MAQTQDGWQLEASAPELYERYLVPAIAHRWLESAFLMTSPSSLRRRANNPWN
jgi:hypothetical protein